MRNLVYVTTVLVVHALTSEANAKPVHQNNLIDVGEGAEMESVDIGDMNGSGAVSGVVAKPAKAAAKPEKKTAAVKVDGSNGKTKFQYEGKTFEYDPSTKQSTEVGKSVEGLVKKEANIQPKTGGDPAVKAQELVTTTVKEDPGTTATITDNGDGTFTFKAKGGTTIVTRTSDAQLELNYQFTKNPDKNKPQKLGEILGNLATAKQAGIESFELGKPVNFLGVNNGNRGYYNVFDGITQNSLNGGGNPNIKSVLVRRIYGNTYAIYGGGGGGAAGAAPAAPQPPAQ